MNLSLPDIKRLCRAIALLGLCCFLAACAARDENLVYRPLHNIGYLPKSDIAVKIPSLSNCTDAGDTRLHLNTQEPVTVIVHGCFSSAGLFRSLAEVFAFHGQQTVCFNYNDRDSLAKSSHELITAIEALSRHMPQARLSVIGHSQGGLIARRAFINERSDRLELEHAKIQLTTISAPFGGIESAAHCGSTTLAWLSLGLVKPLCQLITGRKYSEIPPGSKFIDQPGRLIPAVNRHLKIVTDERDTCRVYNKNGVCIEDDYVFSLDEQAQPAVDADTRLSAVTVKSGHVEIVGNAVTAPQKLIGILQQQGILNTTPPESKKNLAQLLERLYIHRVN
jgi:hypothetical protein